MNGQYASAANAMLEHRYGRLGDPVEYVGSRAWALDVISNRVADAMGPPVPGRIYESPLDLTHEALLGERFGTLPKALSGRVQLAPVLAPGIDTGAVELIPLEPSPRLSPGADDGVDEGFAEFLRHYRGRKV